MLFDGLIVLTKQNPKRTSVTGPVPEYKLKEKFNIRKIDIVDREDNEGKWLPFAGTPVLGDHISLANEAA